MSRRPGDLPHPPGRGAGQLVPSGRRRHIRKAPGHLFDNRGVGASTGSTPDTIQAMAKDAISFIRALGLDEVDLLAFSMGGMIAQVIVQERTAARPQADPRGHGSCRR